MRLQSSIVRIVCLGQCLLGSGGRFYPFQTLRDVSSGVLSARVCARGHLSENRAIVSFQALSSVRALEIALHLSLRRASIRQHQIPHLSPTIGAANDRKNVLLPFSDRPPLARPGLAADGHTLLQLQRPTRNPVSTCSAVPLILPPLIAMSWP
jgi:hypothetical protein